MNEDRTVIESTRFLVEQMDRAVGIPFGDGPWAPVGDHWIEHAARRLNTVLVEIDLPVGVYEMATPGYLGHAVIAVRKGLPINERRFALRHGLAHLVGGELDDCEGGQVRLMSSMLEVMSLEERRADLFALADMVPDWWIAEVPSMCAEDLARGIEGRIRLLLPSWDEFRVKDRAGLRLRLFGGYA